MKKSLGIAILAASVALGSAPVICKVIRNSCDFQERNL